MKRKTLTTLVILTVFVQTIFPQGVINGDFEAWSNKNLFYNPDRINTGNLEQILGGCHQLTIRLSDAASGSSAIMMKSEVCGNDTLFGYFIYGQPYGDEISGGTPFTEKPSSVSMSLKYHTPGTADVIILLMFKKNGLPLSNQIFSITGNQPVWKDTTFNISTLSDFPDTVIFGVAAANPFTKQYHPGNWIAVDNIRFNGVSSQLPNNDFESWNNYDSEEPEGWNTFNLFFLLEAQPGNVVKSLDAHSGNYSISVKTGVLKIFGSSLDTFGVATTGMLSPAGYSGGFVMKAKPDSLTYYYKYNNSNNFQDIALVYVQFSKYDSLSGKSIVIDSGLSLMPASFQWKRMKITFNPSSPVPDTCNIILASSALFFGKAGVGNQLLVDDMLFYYGGVGIPAEELINGKISVFPIPAVNELNVILPENIKSEYLDWRIYSSDGKMLKEIKNYNFNGSSIRIDISDIPSGTYIIAERLNNLKSIFIKK